MAARTIKVDALARVEGEGAFEVVVRDGVVRKAEFRIYEPPRFFEALLRGRSFTDAPDITARICGICPVAYQMSAVQAMEDALGVEVPKPLRDLRRLLYCGEWIESHTLHVYLLHAPDFLGFEGAIDFGRAHPDLLQRGLALKKAGNALVAFLGGREIHPINVRVGGFYKLPRRRDFAALVDMLERARDAALATVRWVACFDFPDCERAYEFVALRPDDAYPFNTGRLVSNQGLDIEARDFDAHFEETQVARSTALHARLRGRGDYLVGPLARYALNFDRLSALAQDAAREAGLGPVCTNPYRSIVVRSIEILFACDEALRLIAHYDEPEQAAVAVTARAGIGHACTEAPRGMLYHCYALDNEGTILSAQIVPPTAQNQASIEADLATCITGWLDLPDDTLRHRCEQTVRNYDPCISCATHFLRVNVDRG